MRSKIHIQHELNKIQHRCGYLPAEELKALSQLAESQGERLPLHRLHEVASFYPHYRLEKPVGWLASRRVRMSPTQGMSMAEGPSL